MFWICLLFGLVVWCFFSLVFFYNIVLLFESLKEQKG